jgi:hypothetical protein
VFRNENEAFVLNLIKGHVSVLAWYPNGLFAKVVGCASAISQRKLIYAQGEETVGWFKLSGLFHDGYRLRGRRKKKLNL